MIDSTDVSVVIPVHNGAAFLAPTLQSIMDQTARPGQVIVVDDGSTDDTASIARSFGVSVLSQAKQGPAAARNAGTRAATGDLIAYLDADDLWSPDKLATQIAALNATSEPAFSFTDFRFFNEHGPFPRDRGLLDHATFRQTAGSIAGRACVRIAAGDRPVLRDNYILPSSVLVRRADVLRVGGFNESIQIGLEDYEFFLRLFRIVPAIVVMQPLLHYRRHAAQVSSKAITMKRGFFEIERLVNASPQRYPAADARYIAEAAFLAHFRIGIEYARLGELTDAKRSFEQSIALRPTARARFMLIAARAADSWFGRRAFGTVRAGWKARPKRR